MLRRRYALGLALGIALGGYGLLSVLQGSSTPSVDTVESEIPFCAYASDAGLLTGNYSCLNGDGTDQSASGREFAAVGNPDAGTDTLCYGGWCAPRDYVDVNGAYYFQTPSMASIAGDQSLCITFRDPDYAVGSNGGLGNFSGSGDVAQIFAWGEVKLFAYFFDGDFVSLAASGDIQDEFVHTACAVLDDQGANSVTSLYVDGKLEASDTRAKDYATATNRWYCGGSGSGSFRMTGKVHGCLVTGKALSSTEVVSLSETIRPLSPVPMQARYLFDAKNIEGTNSSSVANGGQLSRWYNMGTVGASAYNNQSSERPIMRTSLFAGGSPGALWDGDVSSLGLDRSPNFVHRTATFDMVMVMRPTQLPNHWSEGCPLLGNARQTSSIGFFWRLNASDQPALDIYNGTVANYSVAGSTAVEVGNWYALEARGDGTNVRVSHDMQTFATDSTLTGTLSAGAPLQDDDTSWGGPPTWTTITTGWGCDMEVAWLGIWDRELSAGERSTLRSYLSSRFGVQ